MSPGLGRQLSDYKWEYKQAGGAVTWSQVVGGFGMRNPWNPNQILPIFIPIVQWVDDGLWNLDKPWTEVPSPKTGKPNQYTFQITVLLPAARLGGKAKDYRVAMGVAVAARVTDKKTNQVVDSSHTGFLEWAVFTINEYKKGGAKIIDTGFIGTDGSGFSWL
jgi:hypothetical protein